MNNTIVKQFNDENLEIKITDFKLDDLSVYGCDATFIYDLIDKETGIKIDEDYDTITAFMGVEIDDEIYDFLEEKGIDYEKEYDCDSSKLPKKLYDEYYNMMLDMYNDGYQDYFWECEELQQEITEKLMDKAYFPSSKLYVIRNNNVEFIDLSCDYFGVHLKSDTVDIKRVYYDDMEDYVYEIDGVKFDVYYSWGSGRFSLYYI